MHVQVHPQRADQRKCLKSHFRVTVNTPRCIMTARVCACVCFYNSMWVAAPDYPTASSPTLSQPAHLGKKGWHQSQKHRWRQHTRLKNHFQAIREPRGGKRRAEGNSSCTMCQKWNLKRKYYCVGLREIPPWQRQSEPFLWFQVMRAEAIITSTLPEQ